MKETLMRFEIVWLKLRQKKKNPRFRGWQICGSTKTKGQVVTVAKHIPGAQGTARRHNLTRNFWTTLKENAQKGNK